MRWTERQRATLAEMGIRLWGPETLPASASDDQVAAGASDVERVRSASGAQAAATALDDPVAVAVAPIELPRAPAPTVSARDKLRAADDISKLDADALEARAAACTLCALCAGRSRSVFGNGSVQADWMASVARARDSMANASISSRVSWYSSAVHWAKVPIARPCS